MSEQGEIDRIVDALNEVRSLAVQMEMSVATYLGCLDIHRQYIHIDAKARHDDDDTPEWDRR